MTQSYMKTTIDGVNGSGKSGTSARIAVGIAKEYGDGAPVLVADSEERWRFYKKTIFDVEKIELVIVPGKTLVDVRKAYDRAAKEKVCVMVKDQLTTPWMEGVSEFSFENGEMPFERRQQLMNQWRPVIQNFRYTPFHVIACGRLGYFWSKIEDPETGQKKLEQGDTKFNAGGGENFGYEADLELEMRRRKRMLKALFRQKLAVEHICDVVKDAAAGILNGQQFVFPTSIGMYKLGDYKPVLEAFRPYIEFMRTIDAPIASSTSSGSLIVGGRTEWEKDKIERRGYVEELDNLLDQCFPGGEKRSKIDAMLRALSLEYLNGFSSWSRMVDEVETKNLRRNVEIIKAMRSRLQAGERVTDQNSLAGMLHLSTEDLLHPGHGRTLAEVMTAYSVKSALDRKGPQRSNGVDGSAEEERVAG
jgi:hypothetical protein